jgi:hypothetical protein
MNPDNAPFVINTIEVAAKGCLNRNFGGNGYGTNI